MAWNELADWVDWLNANYSMPHARRVQECWPAHPGLVHVLAGLRSAWRASVLSDEQSKGQGNAMAAFHDYHLFPSFQRLEGGLPLVHGHADSSICWGSEIMNHGQEELLRRVSPAGG